MKRSLEQWLEYQLLTHPQAIAMGLDRVREVAMRLSIGRPAAQVAIIGGTNGKGSTVAFMEAIARAGKLRVGAFTSPHLLRYNERVRIDGVDSDDAALIDAFERIEQARGEIPLTYFEFGTLAALLIFQQSGLDLALLEVGLGGKLDAVNIIDADVAVITTVDLDHQEYLGHDRETIGADKAGIFRFGKPCVLAEKDPPSSVLRRAYEIGAFAIRGHADYLIDIDKDDWTWREPGFQITLPFPKLSAPAQINNAAAAIAALRALPLEISDRAIKQGIAQARVVGRLQVLAESPQLVVDVAHNPQAAAQLAEWLTVHPKPTHAVFSALKDKDIEAIVGRLDPFITHWHLAGIEDAGPRGTSAELLAARVTPLVTADRCSVHPSIAAALASAMAEAAADERVLVFGSFHTVAEALKIR
ncbi:MAG: bifunctional tetrahydrofolate synthase/dihydrofolate synthase [Arenimonas sp.]